MMRLEQNFTLLLEQNFTRPVLILVYFEKKFFL